MKIEQQKLSNRHTFTFNSDSFNFAYRDKSGAGDVDVPYAEFPPKSSILIDKNFWLRNVGYIWCLLDGFEIAYAVYAGKSLAGIGFWLLLGIACLLWAHFTTVTYTVFSPRQGSIFVIQDNKTHDQIIEEIIARRRKQLLDWYGDITLENGLEKEIGKFKWLAEQNVLTAQEADQRIARAQAIFIASGAATPVTIN